MKTQICNECGCNIGVFKTVHLFEGKGVCGKCIKILAPGRTGKRVNYAKIAVEAVDRATDMVAGDRAANEAALYEKAKRRVVFFLNGCVTFFWVIILLHLLAIAAVSVAIITGFGR